MSDNTAIMAGYTREVEASCAMHDLHLFVMPGTDYDDTFKAYDADQCEWINVNGWLWTFETIADHAAEAVPMLRAIAHAKGEVDDPACQCVEPGCPICDCDGEA